MLIDGELVDADSRQTFENRNPGHRGGPRRGGRRVGRRDATGDRRRPTGVRRDRLVDRTAPSASAASNSSKRRSRPSGRSCASSSSSRSAAPRMLTSGPQLDAPARRTRSATRSSSSTSTPGRPTCPTRSTCRASPTAAGSSKEPVGVVGAITPWNFPFEVTINKLAQALATGNTVVLKPAPDTPWNATLLGRLVAERTDIPAGVVNVVTSSDHLVGEELTLSPMVDLISFTGSTAVGKRIMEKGAATHEAPLPRARRQVRHDRARRRRPRRLPSMMGLAVCTHAGPGLRHPDAHAAAPQPLRRGRRAARSR